MNSTEEKAYEQYAGVPWQEVAARLGVSLYAAWRRWKKIVKYQ